MPRVQGWSKSCPEGMASELVGIRLNCSFEEFPMVGSSKLECFEGRFGQIFLIGSFSTARTNAENGLKF